MPTTDRFVWAEEVQFEVGASALPAVERSKILKKLDEAISNTACFDFVSAEGAAVEGLEGKKESARHLAMERAQYVADIVKKAGVPSARIFPHVPPAVIAGHCGASTGTCVLIEIQGRRSGPCQSLETGTR